MGKDRTRDSTRSIYTSRPHSYISPTNSSNGYRSHHRQVPQAPDQRSLCQHGSWRCGWLLMVVRMARQEDRDPGRLVPRARANQGRRELRAICEAEMHRPGNLSAIVAATETQGDK